MLGGREREGDGAEGVRIYNRNILSGFRYENFNATTNRAIRVLLHRTTNTLSGV